MKDTNHCKVIMGSFMHGRHLTWRVLISIKDSLNLLQSGLWLTIWLLTNDGHLEQIWVSVVGSKVSDAWREGDFFQFSEDLCNQAKMKGLHRIFSPGMTSKGIDLYKASWKLYLLVINFTFDRICTKRLAGRLTCRWFVVCSGRLSKE